MTKLTRVKFAAGDTVRIKHVAITEGKYAVLGVGDVGWVTTAGDDMVVASGRAVIAMFPRHGGTFVMLDEELEKVQ